MMPHALQQKRKNNGKNQEEIEGMTIQ